MKKQLFIYPGRHTDPTFMKESLVNCLYTKCAHQAPGQEVSLSASLFSPNQQLYQGIVKSLFTNELCREKIQKNVQISY